MTEPFAATGGITVPQDWMDGLIPALPNLAENAIKFEILTVLRDFFEHSEGWRDWFGPITLAPQQPYYSPEMTDFKAELINILDSRRESNNICLTPVVSQEIGPPATLLQEGDPAYYHQTPEGLIAIWPQPATVGERVYFYGSMKPIDLCVPDWIKLKYYDAIVNGVMGRFFAKPGPNLNMTMAAWYQRRYMSQRTDATLNAITNKIAVVERARANPYFASGSQRIRAAYSSGRSGR